MKKCIRKKLKNKKAEGYVDSGVKILIAVVIGALLLGGIYILFKDNVLPTVQTKVESLFNYAGGGIAEVEPEPEPEPELRIVSFYISGDEYQAEEGMTWEEWTESEYNTNGFHVPDNGGIGWLDRHVTSNGKDVSPSSTISEGFRYSQRNLEVIIPC